MTGFRKGLLIFLMGLIIVPSILVQANDGGDIISVVEDTQKKLEDYMAKKDLQQEIAALDKQITELERKNSELRAKEQRLDRKLSNIDEAVRKVEEMDGDLILKAVSVFLFFSLAGFLSSLLFIKIVWRVKVKGIKR